MPHVLQRQPKVLAPCCAAKLTARARREFWRISRAAARLPHWAVRAGAQGRGAYGLAGGGMSLSDGKPKMPR